MGPGAGLRRLRGVPCRKWWLGWGWEVGPGGRRASWFEDAAAAMAAATARGLGKSPAPRVFGSSIKSVRFLCRLRRGLGFPATPSRCLRLDICCLSCSSELTLTLQISQWKVRSWVLGSVDSSPPCSGLGLGPRRGYALMGPSPLRASRIVLCLVPLLCASSCERELTATLHKEQ